MDDAARWEFYNSPANRVPAEGPPRRRMNVSARDIKEMDEAMLLTAIERVAERRAREIAREEVASLCGLMLRRLQDLEKGLPGEHEDVFPTTRGLSTAWGEALRDFTTEKEPGS